MLKISEQVENILKAVPATRSSDKELYIIYMRKFGLGLSPAQEAKFRDMPSLETIRRTRQQLQEQGKYPASVEVEAERKAKQVFMKRGGFKQPEDVLEQHPNLKMFVKEEEPEPLPTKKFYRPLDWHEETPLP